MPATTVQIEVASLLAGPTPAIVAEVRWLGETRTIALSNDGREAGDTPGDNILVGQISGDALRLLPIRLLTAGSPPRELWSGVESVSPTADSLVFELHDRGGTLQADRVAAPWFGQPRVGHERERIDIAGAWMLIAFATVAFLARRGGRA